MLLRMEGMMNTIMRSNNNLNNKVSNLALNVEQSKFNGHNFNNRRNQRHVKQLQAVIHIIRTTSHKQDPSLKANQAIKAMEIIIQNTIDCDISSDIPAAEQDLDSKLQAAFPQQAAKLSSILKVPMKPKKPRAPTPSALPATSLPTLDQLQSNQKLPQANVTIAHVGQVNKSGQAGCYWCTSKGSPHASCHFLKANPTAQSYQL